jgi:putative addiction module component (TIGR02574 family)
MSVDTMMEEFGKLDSESRLELAWKIWDSLEIEKAPTAPTAAQKADLTRRIAELDADPDDVLTHDELLASVRAAR